MPQQYQLCTPDKQKSLPVGRLYKMQLWLYAHSDLLPTTISSSIMMRSPMSTRLIIMVLGSNVEFTDRLPFSVLGTSYHTFICLSIPFQNFKELRLRTRQPALRPLDRLGTTQAQDAATATFAYKGLDW